MSVVHDSIMIGAGPSALTAAIYTTREDIDTVIYEKSVVGGMAAITDWIDNYPGFTKGVAGLDLAQEFQSQAERFGAEIEFGEVTDLSYDDDEKLVNLTVDGAPVKAKTVLIATGSDYKKIGVPGEAEYYARGVHYCATCDGAFYRDKRLAVVGGGNSAIQEAIFLTRYASKIDLLVRSDIKASEILQHDLQKHLDSGKIVLHLGTSTDEIVAKDNAVCGVKVTKDGVQSVIDVDGVFVFVGLVPNTGFLKDTAVELDEVGFIKTDATLRTAMTGVFASGDVRSGATMQIASAVGEGAEAAFAIRKYLEDHERSHGSNE